MVDGVDRVPVSSKDHPHRWLKAFQVFAVLWALICIWQDIDNLARNAHLELDVGTIGITRADAYGAPGFVTIGKITPGSPSAKAGLVEGDQIRFDDPENFRRRPFVGEEVGATVMHAGEQAHVVMVAAPRYQPQPLDWSFVTEDYGNAAASLIMALFSAFIALRSRGKLTTLLLAFGLSTYGLANVVPERSFSAHGLFAVGLVLGALNLASIPVFFHAFALSFYKDTVAPPKRWELGLLAGYAAIMAVLGLNAVWLWLTATPLPIIGVTRTIFTYLQGLGFAAACIYLFLGWQRCRREDQQRYAIMLLAAVIVMIAQLLVEIPISLTVTDATYANLIIASTVLAGLIAPPLFAYAILRHKVLDLGFAINRTIVYAIVSSIVLLAFGLAEWGVDKLLPEETLKANALISAAIALCIFLVFHRIRDLVEHNIERLFFRSWHEKEADLRRFVREATFIVGRDRLVATYVAAIRRFAEGADVALYLADDDGIYRRVEGSIPGQPEVLDTDNPFMVTLRADRSAFEPESGIGLVLPMIHRAEVIGATLLGAKANGFGYRPDEREVLAWAAHQVGLDLHALEVERLQKTNASLAASNRMLSAKYEDLRDMTRQVLSGTA